MAKTYLEFNTVNHHFEAMSYENVLSELEKKSAEDDIELLKKYPESFPKLYDIREHIDPEEKISARLQETELDRPEIVTEAKDVEDKNKRLKLACEMEGGIKFDIMAEPYDRPGEDDPQLKVRVDFGSSLESLNDEKFKQIMAFCERHGISVYDIDLPDAGSEFSLDEKLNELTKKFLADRRAEDIATPEDVRFVEAINLYPAKHPKAPKTLADVRTDVVKYLQKDLHKTRGLTYFEHKKDGMTEFSIYDKPNRDNEKFDGLKDKNGNYVPTYSYRLYIGQNEKTGQFKFGYAMPGNKKLDDVMAGDFMGIIKETGATHLDFKNIPNSDKSMWLVACAEKGIVPIALSLNEAKMNMMKEKARAKLSQEEFIVFEKRLAAQYRENVEAKGKKLQTSEKDMLEGLEAAYDFENFRKGYDDIYDKIIQKIDEGSKNPEEGAATTVGAQRALRTVFSIYEKYPTLGAFVNDHPEYKEALQGINKTTPAPNISPDEWNKIYDALLPAHIENAKTEIISAFKREEKRTPRRSPMLVLSNDVLNNVKGSLNEINIYLRKKGVEQLVLPVDHKSPSFEAYRYAPPAEKSKESAEASKDKTPLPEGSRGGRSDGR